MLAKTIIREIMADTASRWNGGFWSQPSCRSASKKIDLACETVSSTLHYSRLMPSLILYALIWPNSPFDLSFGGRSVTYPLYDWPMVVLDRLTKNLPGKGSEGLSSKFRWTHFGESSWSIFFLVFLALWLVNLNPLMKAWDWCPWEDLKNKERIDIMWTKKGGV